jgi:flagellar biosynthetic protein FliR
MTGQNTMLFLKLSTMELLTSSQGILIFWLVVARIGGLIMSAPLLGSPALPRQVKVAFALTLSFLIFPGLTLSYKITPPDYVVSYLLFFIAEIGLGLILGYTIRLLFVGVQLSGQIIGFQMGLGMAEFLDPQTAEETLVISQFKNILAMLIFISLNAHYLCLKALMDSFTLIPPGVFSLSPPLIKTVIGMVGSIFAISLRAGVPVILTLLLVEVVMGIINRVIPQMNIFMISLPLKIAVGLVVIGLSIPYFLRFLEGLFGQMYQNLILLLKIAGG